MSRKEKFKINLYRLFLLGLMSVTLLCTTKFLRTLNQLNETYADLTKIEYLSSGTQRLTRLAFANEKDPQLVFYIDDQTTQSLAVGGEDNLSVMSDPTFTLMASEVVDSWKNLKIFLADDFSRLNQSSISVAADSHFYQMTNLADEVSQYAQELSRTVAHLQTVLGFLLILVSIVFFNRFMQTQAELKQSKALAQVALIDVATGLYNRSKCQELFKNNRAATGKKQKAIIVLDLNDLKQTNDKLGHRVGDELIHAFASLLKKACSVHVVSPFIGRYGGDEFIVYYDDIDMESDIDTYLKELEFVTDEFNQKESRFKVSYAAGSACVTEKEDEELTMRQLFDLADKAMYENKIAMKCQGSSDLKPIKNEE